MKTERHEGGVGCPAVDSERCRSAIFREAVGMQADMGKTDERLKRSAARVKAVTRFTKDLERAGIIAG